MDALVETKNIINDIHAIGPEFARRAEEANDTDLFVAENFADLKARKLFSAMVPVELGGGGVSHSEMCRAIKTLATYCGSTALTFSMHSHLVAAAVWNHLHGRPGKALLEKVAGGELALISTGAGDWLSSSGTMEKVDGGFRVTARKGFASGCLFGTVLVTSARYDDPDEGLQVLHFPVPMSADGVSIDENWRSLGMRNTGSHTVVLDQVFVPDEAVALSRPCGAYHPVWNIILTVALPLIASAYVGIAEAAAADARALAAKRPDDPHLPYLLGEMENALETATLAHDGLIANANDFQFEPVDEKANTALIRKTIAVNAVTETTQKAVEISGGFGYLRASRLERLLRDSFAGQFHPLPEKKQHHFTGRMALGLDPVAPPPRG